MAKILDFKDKSYFQEVVDEMMEFERQGLVTDLVLIYRRDYTKEEVSQSKAVDAGMICRYWFGDTSSIFCLGLNTNMSHIIAAYVNGEDLIDGD